MEKKLQKMYPKYCILLIARDLWQAHYQILSIIFSEGIYEIKCKYRHDDEKCETCRIKYKCCDSFLEYKDFKHDLIEYKCLCCNINNKRLTKN